MNESPIPDPTDRRGAGVADTLKLLVVTFFGCGLSPVAPGTAGSLGAAAIIAAGFAAAPHPFRAWIPAALAALTVLASFFCVALGPWAIRRWQRQDPQAVVIDEVAGLALTFCLLPPSVIDHPGNGWPFMLLGFVFFRFFDIIKPPPVRHAERFRAGWGILADDLVAGLYAGVAVRVVHLLNIPLFES